MPPVHRDEPQAYLRVEQTKLLERLNAIVKEKNRSELQSYVMRDLYAYPQAQGLSKIPHRLHDQTPKHLPSVSKMYTLTSAKIGEYNAEKCCQILVLRSSSQTMRRRFVASPPSLSWPLCLLLACENALLAFFFVRP